MAYLSIFTLVLGNLVYWITAYYAFFYFDEDFIEKIGAKMSFQSLFSWINVNIVMIKNDFVMLFFLLITEYQINTSDFYIILDTIFTFTVGITIKLMKKIVSQYLLLSLKTRKNIVHGFCVPIG